MSLPFFLKAASGHPADYFLSQAAARTRDTLLNIARWGGVLVATTTTTQPSGMAVFIAFHLFENEQPIEFFRR
jgi:hypothetical protein